MAKQLGPTFGDEIIAAGIGGLPLTWRDTDETIEGRANNSAQNTTLDGVVAARQSNQLQNTLLPTLARFFRRMASLEKQRQQILNKSATPRT
jgi:hypothetical protein